MTKHPFLRLPADSHIRLLPEPAAGFDMLTPEEYERHVEAQRASAAEMACLLPPKPDVLVGHDVATGKTVVFSPRLSKIIRDKVNDR